MYHQLEWILNDGSTLFVPAALAVSLWGTKHGTLSTWVTFVNEYVWEWTLLWCGHFTNIVSVTALNELSD